MRDIAAELAREEAPAVIVGAFPHGDFRPENKKLADSIYSIYGGKPLETWTVVSHLLAVLADYLGIV